MATKILTSLLMATVLCGCAGDLQFTRHTSKRIVGRTPLRIAVLNFDDKTGGNHGSYLDSGLSYGGDIGSVCADAVASALVDTAQFDTVDRLASPSEAQFYDLLVTGSVDVFKTGVTPHFTTVVNPVTLLCLVGLPTSFIGVHGQGELSVELLTTRNRLAIAKFHPEYRWGPEYEWNSPWYGSTNRTKWGTRLLSGLADNLSTKVRADLMSGLGDQLKETINVRPQQAATKARLLRHAPVISKSNSTDGDWLALLIGISDYVHNSAGCPDLNTPIRDVKALGTILKGNYGFSTVTTLIDEQATRRGILLALDDLFEKCSESDNVLLYYAGHGDLASDGSGIWLPSDARDRVDAIQNAVVKDKLTRLKARRVLLISDSCYAGSFLTRAMAIEPVKDDKEAVAVSEALLADQRPCREVLTSGSLRPVEDQSTLGTYAGHSPFAGALINALESARPGAVISSADIFYEVERQVRSLTNNRQHPQLSAFTGGQAGGQFFMVRRQEQ